MSTQVRRNDTSLFVGLGGLLVFGGETGARLAGTIWPIVLIGLGVLVLAGASAVRRSQAPHQRSHP